MPEGCELCDIIDFALRPGLDEKLETNQENIGVWLEDYNLTKSRKPEYCGRCLGVFYGPVGNIDSSWGEVFFATNEGSMECSTG
jgi:hypothetical protein